MLTWRRAYGLAFFALTLAACAPSGMLPASGETGTLAMLVAGDTTVVDRYRIDPARLTGDLQLFSREPGGPTARASYTIDYASDGRPVRAHVDIRQYAPSGAPDPGVREWTATFSGDGSVAESEGNGGRRFESVPGRDALPLFGPSVAMMEAIIRRARATGATRIPVFHLATAARVDTMELAWLADDSVRVTFAGASGDYHVDATGRILGGLAAAEPLRTVRLD